MNLPLNESRGMEVAMKEILLSIVNDLEKTAASLVMLTADVRAIKPKSLADQQESLRLAVKANADFYGGLRKKIESLPAGKAL
jgi:hypothetical protein